MLYRPKSEHARSVEEYVREFERREASRKVELLDIDSKEGTSLADLYAIVDQPAILVLANDGQLVQMWVGPQLPLMDEVAAFGNAGGNFFVAPQE